MSNDGFERIHRQRLDTISQLEKITQQDRFRERKSSKMHNDALENIKRIMNVDDDEAFAYKSFLYNEIRENNPDFRNFERAKELLRITENEEELKDKLKNENIELLKEDMKRRMEKNSKAREERRKSFSLTDSDDGEGSTKSKRSDSKGKNYHKGKDTLTEDDEVLSSLSDVETSDSKKKTKKSTSKTTKNASSKTAKKETKKSTSKTKKTKGGMQYILSSDNFENY
jgi:hypothetical protein